MPTETGQKSTLPERIDTLQNLTVIPADAQPPDTVEMVPVQDFKSNEDVFIQGYIVEVEADRKGRVYLLSSAMGESAMYVFQPDGDFLTTIGRHGNGPGEYAYIRSLVIKDDSMFLYDAGHFKFMVYSLDDYSLVEEELVEQSHVNRVDTAASRLKGRDLYVTSNGTRLVRLWSTPNRSEIDLGKYLYYRITKDGTVVPGRFLEQERFELFYADPEEYIPPGSMPFSRQSLIAVSEGGPIYTVWSEDFLIKVLEPDGDYRRAIYYPYENRALHLEDSPNSGQQGSRLEGNRDRIPDTWPAVHRMEVDDQNRLWVATITESDTSYKWWVLNERGELLARFDWPGEPWSRPVGFLPDMEIMDGFFYTIDLNINDEINRVIKHRIDFKPHPHSETGQ